MHGDRSTWITKAKLAERWNITEKAVELIAKKTGLVQELWRRPAGGPRIVVYDPVDVVRVEQERQPGPRTAVLPPMSDPTAPAAGDRAATSLNLTALMPAADVELAARDLLLGLARAVAAATAAATSETSESSEKWILTVAEAAARSGWTEAYLRRAIRDKRLPAERDRGLRVKLADLKRFCGLDDDQRGHQ